MAEAGSDGDRGDGPAIRLRIIATSDLHCQVWPLDYATWQRQPGFGLAAAAQTIARLRAEVPNAILVDNGDLLQGNALGDRLVADWEARAAPHPLTSALAQLGYDAATVGNHDLNYGLDYLGHAWRSAGIPLVSANLVRTLPDGSTVPVFAPSALIARELLDAEGTAHRVSIGVTGALPEPSATWDRLVLGPAIASAPVVPAIAEAAANLKARGADIVLALCHSGIGGDGCGEPGENAALEVAALEPVDAVVAGHTHGLFPPARPWLDPPPGVDADGGRLHGRPAVQPPARGRGLGVIDLVLRRDDRGRWRPVSGSGRLEPTARAVARIGARAPWAALRPFHDRVMAEARHPLALLGAPLANHFALIGCDPAGRLLGECLIAHGRRVLAATGIEPLPVLAATAPVVAGGRGGPDRYIDLPEGPLMRGHLAEIYPFPNPACMLRLGLADLRAWLEQAASFYHTVATGSGPVALFRSEDPPYVFDTIWGITYQIDPTGPPGARIGPIRLATGELLSEEDRVVVVTNSHRASGASGYEAARRGELVDVTRRPLRDLFADWLADRGTIRPDPTPTWDFAPAGRTAWFPSGHGAEARLGTAPCRRLRDGGPGPDAFRRILLDL